YQQYNSVPRTF
nr:immunoglobulin light chain junction region [Macaca mulatta]